MGKYTSTLETEKHGSKNSSKIKNRRRRSKSRSNSTHSYSKSSKLHSNDNTPSWQSSSSSSFDSDKCKSQNELKTTIKSTFVDMVDNKALDEINEDKFTQKQFSSSRLKKVPENILIDLKKNTIKVPEVEISEPDTIFYYNLFLNEEARLEKWIKELYSFRHKALQKGLKSGH